MEKIYNDDIREALGTHAFGAAGLVEGTNANTIKTANAIDFCIHGIIYSKAATDNIAMTAAVVQNISTHCMYLISIDKAGAVTVTKGAEAKIADDIFLPSTPADQAVIGAFKIVTDGSTTFTSGTTDLGASGITDTFFDLIDNWRKTFLGL